MATVYRAVDRRHNRRVAMKIFPPELAAAIGPERFRREIAITSRLVHPHILALHDSGEAAGTLYYVMPLVEGESLRKRLDREPGGLPTDEVVSIARQIADALGYAHRLGVVHRDVTPENILLADGHALLADFGIARLLEGEPLTDSGTPLGTALYRSPEQAAGHRDVDGRSDIYSLGCVLYHALAGAKAEEHLSSRFARAIPPVGALRTGVPPSVAAAVARAMMADSNDRFPSAQELSRALDTPMQSARATRRRPLVLGAVTVSLALVATLFTVLRPREPALDPKRVLVSHFENRTGDRSLDVLADIAGDYVARGLAETRLVEVVDARGTNGDTAVSPAGTRRQAAVVGAATTIRGSFYRERDSLHFETQVLDTRSGKLIIATDPASGASAERMAIVERLRQRLMASFAVLFGSGFEAWDAQSLPPSYEAYQEVLAGGKANYDLDFAGAVGHFKRAAAMDSNYQGAKTMTILAAALDGDCGTADSVIRLVDPLRARLRAVDRGQLEWGEAQCRGDWPASLTAGRAVMAVAPRSVDFTILLGVTALEVFRPREALTVLGKLDPDRLGLTQAQRTMHGDFTALAYHELGDPEGELAVARRGLRHLPDNPVFRNDELMALAGQGKLEAMKQRRDAWFQRHDLFANTVFSPGQVDLCLGVDLRAHGRLEAGMARIADAADWYRTRPAEERSGPIPLSCSIRLLVPLYYLERWEEATALYRAMLEADSTSDLAHEALGALAARRRDRVETVRMEQWLATHDSREKGRSTYARARIAALLGETERAMRLLDQAFDEGLKHRMWVHVDPDLESLKNLPAYRQLLAPTG